MDTTTVVDYRRTSLRPTWASLPAGVRAEVTRLVGPVVAAAPAVTSGFTGSYAGRVTLADGREVFVKAGGPDMHHVVGALAQEARVLAALPEGVPAPTLLGAGSVDGWSLLVLGVIEGRMPGQPWSDADVESVHEACLTLARLATPAPPALQVPGVAAEMAGDDRVVAFARGLVDGTASVPAWAPSWLHDRRAEVARLTLDVGHLLAEGSTLTHGDLRPDNLLVDAAGTAWVVDWNWVGAGPAWVDLTGLLPLMRVEGVDTDALERRSPLLRDADPEAVDSFLATIACYMLEGVHRPPPPGCTPALRAHQRLFAEIFLDHLAHRRRWDR